MLHSLWAVAAAGWTLALGTGVAFAAGAQPPAAAPAVAVPLPSIAPRGAIVLFSGKADELAANWFQRRSQNPPRWTVGKDGALSPQGGDLISKQSFGDCYLHVEFKCPEGHGNAGVGLQGRYEVQIYNSFGQAPEAGNAGALYSQKPARVEASRKAGEWQSYDILFRAPRFDKEGRLTEKPRVTVFHNGVLIHNNEEFAGMTGIQYDEFKEMKKTGPIVLQGDHDPVQYRNLWIVPL